MKSENQLFKELEELCKTKGFINVIAFLCLKYNTIVYEKALSKKSFEDFYSQEKLINNEINVLIALLLKNYNDSHLLANKDIIRLAKKAEKLLLEIHHSMYPPFNEAIESNSNPFSEGRFLRESIFYSSESAYNFQYRELIPLKYKSDNEWFKYKMGYSIEEGLITIDAISSVQNVKLNEFLNTQNEQNLSTTINFVDIFSFTVDEVVNKSGLQINLTKRILKSYSTELIELTDFNSIDDYNRVKGYPIINPNNEHYILFNNYSLLEAFYETPFYWLINDNEYAHKALSNRGKFTEDISFDKLIHVFGSERVYRNVIIKDKSGKSKGEIDVLVQFSNICIVLQAKSKRLTIKARKGNDEALKNDFNAAIQDSYDQAYSCSKLLYNKDITLVDSNGATINLTYKIQRIYPICILSDHYPALSFQSLQLLNFDSNKIIQPPYVIDVFLLDVLVEFLNTPLHLLSYIDRRVKYKDRVVASQELVILSYHLSKNLRIEKENQRLYLQDDISTDLDLSFLVRRTGLPGPHTPSGILTNYRNTFFEHLIHCIENIESPAAISLGFSLLSLNSETIEIINQSVEYIQRICKNDQNNHDASIKFGQESKGLTIHGNYYDSEKALSCLKSHCEIRKYSVKAEQWFGICINPNTLQIRHIISSNFTHKYDSKLEKLTKNLSRPNTIHKGKINTTTFRNPYKKLGRNDPCFCQSGKKYKYCCLNK